MTLLSGGNVSIGTTAPASKFHIKVGTDLNLRFGYPSDATASIAALNDAASAYVQMPIDALSVSINAGSGGPVMIGIATASANAAGPSLLIAQGAADDKVLIFGSSVVAHGRTTLLETDKYASFAKSSATGGGLTIMGITDADATTGNVSLRLLGYTADAALDTTKSTAGLAAVVIGAGITDGGTSCTTPGANENLMVIQAYATTRFIFDQEGSGHADVEWVAFADHDDVALVRDLEREMIPGRFGQSLIYNREAFESVGIVGKGSWHEENGRQHAMVNFTRLSMLHHGALQQVADRMMHLEAAVEARQVEIAELKQQMAQLKETN